MAAPKPGYAISIDAPNKVLKMRLWGMWDTTTAQRFEQEAREKIQEIGRQTPDGWDTMVDLSDFPPQRDEVQEMTNRVMQLEKTHGMNRGASVTKKAMTKHQVQRLAKQQGFDPGSFFQSEDEAMRWLLSQR
jgi:CRISPR/Cas system CSM-associated protein Csm4 (group 5 of RAMP superfamily)